MLLMLHLCFCFPRPHVVTVQWLLDSFTKGSLLPESGYFHPDCPPPAVASVSVSARHTSPSRPSLGPPAASPSTPRQKRAEEDLLSQYVDDDPTVGMYLLLRGLLVVTCNYTPLSEVCWLYLIDHFSSS